MPLAKRLGVSDGGYEFVYSNILRFISQLDKGITYGDPRAVDLMVSLVKMKDKTPLLYEYIKNQYGEMYEDDGYFSIVDRMHAQGHIIPKYAGRLLDNPSAPQND